jgi:hypothetical protein
MSACRTQVFALGDVRGGKDLFAASGKGGIRFQW